VGIRELAEIPRKFAPALKEVFGGGSWSGFKNSSKPPFRAGEEGFGEFSSKGFWFGFKICSKKLPIGCF
jgi:hypothetical protein